MLASLIRIAIVVALGFGAYKLYPQYKPIVQKQIENPGVLGETVGPVIDNINTLLPDNIQIPTPGNNDDQPGNPRPISVPPAVQQAIDEIKVKTTEITNQQIEIIKKEASKQFCSALIEKIKTECPTQ